MQVLEEELSKVVEGGGRQMVVEELSLAYQRVAMGGSSQKETAIEVPHQAPELEESTRLGREK